MSSGPGWDSPDPARAVQTGTGDGPPFVHEALSADTRVEQRSGRWVVLLDVVLDTGAVTRVVGDFHDERRARQAAAIIERNARRSIPVPTAEPASAQTDTKTTPPDDTDGAR